MRVVKAGAAARVASKLQRREDQKPAGQSAADPSDLDHGLAILRLHDQIGSLRQLDHQGVKIIVVAGRNRMNLEVFIA